MYLLISFIIITVFLLVLNTKKYLFFKSKYEESLSFFITILSTFLGVFIAVYFTDQENKRIEKTQTLKMLNVAKYDLEKKIGTINTCQSLMEISKTDSVRVHPGFWKNDNWIKYPEFYGQIIFETDFNKNLSKPTLNKLIDINEILKNISEKSYETKTKEIFLNDIDIYIKMLLIGIETCDLEVKFQNGEIKEEELQNIISQKSMQILDKNAERMMYKIK